MPQVNRYVDISQVDKEAKKDYIDRHSPFVHVGAASDGRLAVTVRMGKEYQHPDDNDHYIKSIQLYNGQTMLAEASFPPGVSFGHGNKGNLEVTFHIAAASGMSLTAMSYCTKHGLWESDPVTV